LREEGGLGKYHAVGVVKHAEESLLLLMEEFVQLLSPFQELRKPFILHSRFCWQ